MAITSLIKLPVVGYESEEAFLHDLNAMMKLAEGQPGFIRAQVWKSPTDENPLVYMVESEWESKAHMALMEHHPEHQPVMDGYPLAKEIVHLRLVPWTG